MEVRTRPMVAGVAAVLLALTVGCRSMPAADKAGNQTVVLRLASIDPINDNGQSYGPQAFIDQLAAVSGGRIKVEITTDFGHGSANSESSLVTAIAKGEVDGGWPSTRSFAAAGIGGLESVEAPMMIRSYAAEKALVSGELAGRLLAHLDHSDVVGLGLMVGPLRRPFAAESALVAPEDWKGVSFRTFGSRVERDAVAALGAIPVDAGTDWIDLVGSGDLSGGEMDLAQYALNNYGSRAGNVTSNVVLWPKVFVLTVNRSKFEGLSDEQRTWIRTAAENAVQTSVASAYDEDSLIPSLCRTGVRFARATPDQIEELHRRLQPVRDRLTAAHPADMAGIRTLVNRYAEIDEPAVPADCMSRPETTRPRTKDPGTTAEDVSSLPDGTYRVAISIDDVTAAKAGNEPGWTGIWTLTVRDGTYELTCRVDQLPGTDCGHETTDDPLEVGDLRGRADEVRFHGVPERLAARTGCSPPGTSANPDDDCAVLPDYVLHWSVDGKQLTFTDPVGPESSLTYLLKPWTKIN